ncbi:MAG: hypothetical protein Q8M92_04825, partial [Candidatus Subteraquimicrobiales bacterium]|nr:hypothetical protein [Candidatus Subteraquimicrobiales bacterium]
MGNPQLLNGKRVLFVLSSFQFGGAERQAMHLACHLKRLGCDVRVWGHHRGYSETGIESQPCNVAGIPRAIDDLVIEQCNAAGIPWTIRRFL